MAKILDCLTPFTKLRNVERLKSEVTQWNSKIMKVFSIVNMMNQEYSNQDVNLWKRFYDENAVKSWKQMLQGVIIGRKSRGDSAKQSVQRTLHCQAHQCAV